MPESMKPLIWDFGQLNSETEELYARQIVNRYVSILATLLYILKLVLIVIEELRENAKMQCIIKRMVLVFFAYKKQSFDLKIKVSAISLLISF